jgi:hypothetical protein
MPSGMGWEKKNRKNNMITLSGKPKKKQSSEAASLQSQHGPRSKGDVMRCRLYNTDC